jgi:aspartyl-tRNA(Asn)/glutamyl-tRNA(Gln) amidotransferase subunit C
MVTDRVQQRQFPVGVQLTGVRPNGFHLHARHAHGGGHKTVRQPVGRDLDHDVIGCAARCSLDDVHAQDVGPDLPKCRRYRPERARAIRQHHAEQIRHGAQSYESLLPVRKCRVPNSDRKLGVAGRRRRLDFQAVPDHTVNSSTTRISRAEVAHLARLARLAVTEQELDVFAGQLDVILGSVARVGEVAAADIEPTTHAVPLRNVLRPDEVGPCLDRSIVLAQAPAVEDNRFRVPRILDDEQ